MNHAVENLKKRITNEKELKLMYYTNYNNIRAM